MESSSGALATVGELPTPSSSTTTQPGEAVSPTELLPPEVWHEVFLNLKRRDLCNVRLSCRTLNDIVGSSSQLMECFPIHLDQSKMTKFHDLRGFSGRFSNVTLYYIMLEDSDNWLSTWKHVGESIQSLSMRYVRNPSSVMLDFFLAVPNLKKLLVDPLPEVSFDELSQMKTKGILRNLRELDLSIGDEDQLEQWMEMFQTVCPFVKKFSITINTLPFNDVTVYERAMVPFIQAARAIENIQLFPTSRILQELSEHKLKTVTFLDFEIDIAVEDVINFTRSVPTIERFDMSDIAIPMVPALTKIGQNLPNLKQIEVPIDNDIASPHDDLPFLQHMPKLEHLHLHQNSPSSADDMLWIKSISGSSPMLRDLLLSGVRFSRYVLLNYLRQSPSMRHLYLSHCHVESLSDIVLLATQLKSLENFGLHRISCTNRDIDELHDNNPISSSNVRTLKLTLTNANNWEDFVVLLINLCPALEELELNECANDFIIFKIFQSLRKLKSLTLFLYNISMNGLDRLNRYAESGVKITLIQFSPGKIIETSLPSSDPSLIKRCF